MAARPSTVPTWSTNANYTGGPAVGTPTCVAPSGPAQAEGWEPGQKPGAQNQNWWQNLAGQWLTWLAAGNLDGNWEFTGNVAVDGTFTGGSTATFTGAVTASDFKLSAAQAYIIPASMADPGGNTRVNPIKGTKAWQFSGATAVTFPVPCKVGDTITGYFVYLNKTSNAGTTISARLYTSDGGGTETAQGTGMTTNAVSPGSTSLSEGVAVGPIVAGTQVYITVDGASGNDIVTGASVSHLH